MFRLGIADRNVFSEIALCGDYRRSLQKHRYFRCFKHRRRILGVWNDRSGVYWRGRNRRNSNRRFPGRNENDRRGLFMVAAAWRSAAFAGRARALTWWIACRCRRTGTFSSRAINYWFTGAFTSGAFSLWLAVSIALELFTKICRLLAIGMPVRVSVLSDFPVISSH